MTISQLPKLPAWKSTAHAHVTLKVESIEIAFFASFWFYGRFCIASSHRTIFCLSHYFLYPCFSSYHLEGLLGAKLVITLPGSQCCTEIDNIPAAQHENIARSDIPGHLGAVLRMIQQKTVKWTHGTCDFLLLALSGVSAINAWAVGEGRWVDTFLKATRHLVTLLFNGRRYIGSWSFPATNRWTSLCHVRHLKSWWDLVRCARP